MAAEIFGANESLVAGAIAIGAVSGIVSTFILVPLIDRYLRKPWRLEPGTAMLLLLILSLLVGVGTGIGGFFWLRSNEPEPLEEVPPIRVEE